MEETLSSSGDAGVWQLTDTLPAGEYAFSAYMQLLSDVVGTNDGAGVFLRVTDTSDTILAQSERITEKSTEYVRAIRQGVDLYQWTRGALCGWGAVGEKQLCRPL